jgi:hypothetical protein
MGATPIRKRRGVPFFCVDKKESNVRGICLVSAGSDSCAGPTRTLVAFLSRPSSMLPRNPCMVCIRFQRNELPVCREGACEPQRLTTGRSRSPARSARPDSLGQDAEQFPLIGRHVYGGDTGEAGSLKRGVHDMLWLE